MEESTILAIRIIEESSDRHFDIKLTSRAGLCFERAVVAADL